MSDGEDLDSEALDGEEVESENLDVKDETDESTGVIAVIGTYDGALLGFDTGTGKQAFGFTSHLGCVKALGCSGGRLASGGTDNIVRLFNMEKRVEVGDLQEHTDSVTSLSFVGEEHLVTCCDGGKICVWRCSDWELLLKFRGHQAAITCNAPHPSGCVLVSAARDSTLRLWDLTRGTSVAQRILTHAVESLAWAPGGEHFLALTPMELIVVEASNGRTASMKTDVQGFLRVNLTTACFLSHCVLVLGNAKGEVQIVELSKVGDELALNEQFKLVSVDGASRGRLRATASCPGQDSSVIFMLGDSVGRVEIWSFKTAEKLSSDDFTFIRTVNTQTRLTNGLLWTASENVKVAPVRKSKPKAPLTKSQKRKKAGLIKKKKAKHL